MAWLKSVIEPFRALTLRFWMTFVLACLVAQGLEWLANRATHQTESSGHSLMEATGLYQKLVTRARDPQVRFTTLVVIDPHEAISVSSTDVCNEREFLAVMLQRLAQAGATMVVIDKFFGATSCLRTSSNVRLQEAIAHLRRGEAVNPGEPAFPAMPIVIGERANERDADQRKLADVTRYLEAGLPLETADTHQQQGLANVAFDHRKLPLRWTVYKDERSAMTGDVIEVDGLALAAARSITPTLLETNTRLRDLLASGEQPYIGFLLPEEFKKSSFHLASEVVCNDHPDPQQDWHECAKVTPLPKFAHGRIVLIGEEDPSDAQSTIVGPMMGYYLQANYIEALLDDRFFAPVQPIVNLGVSLLFLILLELVLTLFHDSPLKAVFWVLVLGVCTLGVVLQLVMYARIYVDPSLVTASYVFLRLSHLAFSHIPSLHRHNPTGAPPAPPPPAPSQPPPPPSPPPRLAIESEDIEREGG